MADGDAVATLEALDSCDGVRKALTVIAEKVSEYAGIPMPIEGMPLVVDPSQPFAHVFAEKVEPDASGARIRSVFWSHRWRVDVAIVEEADGSIWKAPATLPNQGGKILQTLGAADAWGIEQEARALDLLASMAGTRKFRQYLLTGTFAETSPRSGVVYVFRRLRPTLAVSLRGEEARILCALCLHPIAYYADSWAGAMCPTDDVVAHLAMMRGDEPMFWRRANQHPAWRPEAGI